MKQLRYILLLALFASAPSSSVAQVRELGLPEIVQSAKTICVATVTGVKGAVDASNDIVTYTTFKLDVAIAGNPANTFTIKQIGGEHKGLSHKLEHIRYFTKGEKVVLTLYPNSELGFTNPVGLNQGVWSVDAKNNVIGVSHDQLISAKLALPKQAIPRNTQSITTKHFVALLKDIRSTVVKGGNRGN